VTVVSGLARNPLAIQLVGPDRRDSVTTVGSIPPGSPEKPPPTAFVPAGQVARAVRSSCGGSATVADRVIRGPGRFVRPVLFALAMVAAVRENAARRQAASASLNRNSLTFRFAPDPIGGNVPAAPAPPRTPFGAMTRSLQDSAAAQGSFLPVNRGKLHSKFGARALAVALLLGLALPATAFAGAVITPIPTFPYPSVTIGTQFAASITMVNNSTGQEAAAGVTVTASNLDLFPSCPDSVITANNCPNAEAGVFALSATGTSGAGQCPAGTWTIAEAAPGRFRFTPSGTIGLLPGASCTVNFTAVATRLPQFDANLTTPGSQTNQVASVDAFSPVTSLTVRNSGTGQTTVLQPQAPSSGGAAGPNASLKVSEGCKRIVTAKVTGEDIQSVTFLVDGKPQATVKSAPFQTKIKALKLSTGHHSLTAKVTFSQSSGELPAKFQGGFLRCKPPRQPNFTG
jgi:Bacterial Ig domain